MLKRQKSSFIKLCNKLEEYYLSDENEITYVRRSLEEWKISEDRDKLLKIKAEGEEMDFNINTSLIVGILSMVIATFSLIIQSLSLISDSAKIIISIFFFILLILLCIWILSFDSLKSVTVRKWRKYILCVVNQIIAVQTRKQTDALESKKEKSKKKQK